MDTYSAPTQTDNPTDGAAAAPRALARTAAEAERHQVAGGEIAIRLRGEETGGLCALVENTIPAGYAGTPPHFHRHTDELVYVLDGELSFRLGEEVFVAGPGAVVHLPRGAVHTFVNLGDRPARLVNFCTAGAERFFDDLAAALAEGDGEVAPVVYARLAADHDMHVVGAPTAPGAEAAR